MSPPRGARRRPDDARVQHAVDLDVGNQTRSSAALSPPSTTLRRCGGKVPSRPASFSRSNVVSWWQSAMLDRFTPPAPRGNGTAVGPLSSCALDVETGTTITVFQLGARLKPSWDTTMTGLRPRCSEPDRGLRSAQKTSPRLSADASAASSVAPKVPETRSPARDRDPPGCRPFLRRRS